MTEPQVILCCPCRFLDIATGCYFETGFWPAGWYVRRHGTWFRFDSAWRWQKMVEAMGSSDFATMIVE